MTKTNQIMLAQYATFGLLTFLLLFTWQTNFASAAEKCNFTRDLEMGVNGEDVRCLQKYLNSAGFKIADSGPGAPGGETTLFRDATKTAVIKWQTANKVAPATGYFGSVSRAKYNTLVSGTSTNSGSSVDAEREAILARIRALQSGNNNTPTNESPIQYTQSSAKKALEETIDALSEAEEQVDDARDSGVNIGRAEDRMKDAREEFYTAVTAYLDGNYQRTVHFAQEAKENALDAYEDAGGETEEDEIDEYLDELSDDIDDAKTTIEARDDDGDDVEESEELIEEAEDRLQEAEDALDERDYDKARDLGEEVEDLIDDAIDAIGNSREDKEDAEKAIDDAIDAISDAKDAIRKAKRDGDDVDEAEDLLDEAEERFDEAEDAFDDEDYDEAIELAEEAEDLADEATDEL